MWLDFTCETKNTSSRQFIDAWAQSAFKGSLLPEVVLVFEQSGSARLLSQDLSLAIPGRTK